MKEFEITNTADNIPEITLRGTVDEYDSASLSSLLYELKDTPIVRMRINSPGGSVRAAYGIISAMNAYYQRGGEIETINESIAGSAAGWIFSFGTKGKRHILQFAQMMLHAPSMQVQGEQKTADDLPEGEERDYLQEIADNLVDIYAAATNIKRDKIKQMMQQETWLSAKESVRLGFADNVVEISNAPKLRNDLTPLEVYNTINNIDFSYDLNTFKMAEKKPDAEVAAKISDYEMQNSLLAKELAAEKAKAEKAEQELQNLLQEKEREKMKGINTFVDNAIKEKPTLEPYKEQLITAVAAVGVDNFVAMAGEFSSTVKELPQIDNGIKEEQPTGAKSEMEADALRFGAMSEQEREELKNTNYVEYNRVSSNYMKFYVQ